MMLIRLETDARDAHRAMTAAGHNAWGQTRHVEIVPHQQDTVLEFRVRDPTRSVFRWVRIDLADDAARFTTDPIGQEFLAETGSDVIRCQLIDLRRRYRSADLTQTMAAHQAALALAHWSWLTG